MNFDLEDFSLLLTEYLLPYGRDVNESIIWFWAKALQGYDLPDIRRAFERHVQDPAEGQFPPMPAHLMAYLPRKSDGRPAAAVVWGVLPMDEGSAAFLPQEAMVAYWNHVYPALEAGKSPETARPFFVREYEKLVQESRDRGEPLRIEVTLGQRGETACLGALRAAVEAGAVPLAWAQGWCQRVFPGRPDVLALPAGESLPRTGKLKRLALPPDPAQAIRASAIGRKLLEDFDQAFQNAH